MSIETDIRFIAKSIQWQNKLLLDLLSRGNSDIPRNECNHSGERHTNSASKSSESECSHYPDGVRVIW